MSPVQQPWWREGPEYEALLDQLVEKGNSGVKAGVASARQLLQRMRSPKTLTEKKTTAQEVAFNLLELEEEGKDRLPKKVPYFRGCLPAGDKIDVILNASSLYLMKEKGKLRLAWQTDELNAWPENACYDGRYVWVPVKRVGKTPWLLVLDPVSAQVWQITAADGLPLVPPEDLPTQGTFQYLATAPLAPGKVCVAGTFGRTWLAIVTFDPTAGKTVKVFHEAREAYDPKDKEQRIRTTVAFEPGFMFTLKDKPTATDLGSQRVLIGRESRNYVVTLWPLLVDPQKLTVEMVPELTYLSYLKKGEVREGAVYTVAIFPNELKRHFMRLGFPGTKMEPLIRDVPDGRAVVQGDRFHIVGDVVSKKWWVGSLAEKRLRLAGQLPGNVLWVAHSNHYGLLIGTQDNPAKAKRTVYQVVFPEDKTTVIAQDKERPKPDSSAGPGPKNETPAQPKNQPPTAQPKNKPPPAQVPKKLPSETQPKKEGPIQQAGRIWPIVSQLALVTVGTGKQSRLVAALKQPAELEDLTAQTMQSILARELFRQGLLLAAREGLGLETRDEVLGETIPAGEAGAPVQFSSIGEPFVEVKLTRPSPRGGEQQLLLLHFRMEPNPDYLLRLAEKVELLAREDLQTALVKAGAGRALDKGRGDAALPAVSAQQLAYLNIHAQFAALRDLHEAVWGKGPSPALLGELARAYANLGVLTEHHWNAAHKAYKARALLYAQRLVAADPASAWGRWHRAYALALMGLHRLALEDLAQAAKLNKDQSPPAWVAVVNAYCRFDTSRLEQLARGDQEQLAGLLQFLTVEHPTNLHLAVNTAQKALKVNPECYRIHDGVCALAGVSFLHRATLVPFVLLDQTLPSRLQKMPTPPAAVTDLLKGGIADWKQNEAKVNQALRDTMVPGEPSWGALAGMMQETRFVNVWRRLEFLLTRGPWEMRR